MKIRLLRVVLLVVLIASLHGSALAQTYLFSVDQEIVNVFLNPDGTVAIDYVFVFTNNPSADHHPQCRRSHQKGSFEKAGREWIKQINSPSQ